MIVLLSYVKPKCIANVVLEWTRLTPFTSRESSQETHSSVLKKDEETTSVHTVDYFT